MGVTVNVVLDVFAFFPPVTRPAHRERGLKAAGQHILIQLRQSCVHASDLGDGNSVDTPCEFPGVASVSLPTQNVA